MKTPVPRQCKFSGSLTDLTSSDNERCDNIPVPNPVTLCYYEPMATLDSTSLHRFLEQFTETFTPELADHFTNLPPNSELQKRLDELGEKANEGTLNEDERREYATYVEAMDVIALLRVKSMARVNSDSAES